MATGKKTNGSNGNGNGANLGFEEKLWLAAEKMRGHMDVAQVSQSTTTANPRRLGDAVAINGDHQFRAASQAAPSAQRFWHEAKLREAQRWLDPQPGEMLLEWMLDVFRLVPKLAEEQHVASYTRSSLAALASRAGLKLHAHRGINLAAPRIVPRSWQLAEAVHWLESSRSHPSGSPLLMTFVKPGGPRA